MPNMSYCRFQNTLIDLTDCQENWEEYVDNELSIEEKKAKEELLQLCKDIVDEHREE